MGNRITKINGIPVLNTKVEALEFENNELKITQSDKSSYTVEINNFDGLTASTIYQTNFDVYLNFKEVIPYDFYCPYNMMVNSYESSSTGLTITINYSGSPYVYGSSLPRFGVLSITGTTTGTVVLNCERI